MNKELAQRLLEKVAHTINYNINIMDERGTIIASTDRSREGTFHEIAFNMIKNDSSITVVEEDDSYLGTRPGVNMGIRHQGRLIGVVGITGNPSSVRPLAELLKTTVELIYEKEAEQENYQRRQSLKDRFFNQLLYVEPRSSKKLEAQGSELGYKEGYYRIPILITTESEEIDKIRTEFKTSPAHTVQDIFIVTGNNTATVFLHINKNEKAAGIYRQRVEEYINKVESKNKDIICTYRVGTLQSEYIQYHVAFEHAKWLKYYLEEKDARKIEYFYDYVIDYLAEKIPYKVKNDIFSAFVESMGSGGFWANYTAIFGSMQRNNDNLVDSAKEMHMHKNTLLYQYNKYRESLNINPLANRNDKNLTIALYDYMVVAENKYSG